MSADHWCPQCVTVSLCTRDLMADEMRVLGWIADRLRIGAVRYKALDIHGDHRDWRAEKQEEAADLLVYAACEDLKKRR